MALASASPRAVSFWSASRAYSVAAGLQVGQELLDILRGAGLELLLSPVAGHRTPRRADERLLQQGERPGFGLAGIGRQRTPGGFADRSSGR